MNVQVYQDDIVGIITAYGRPPTIAAHLRKLGEEVGELAEACAILPLRINDGEEAAMNAVIEECADVINVVTSLLDKCGGKLDVALENKLVQLEVRIRDGRRDKRYGSQSTTPGVYT